MGGSLPSALAMWCPTPFPHTWLFLACGEQLRGDWGCDGEQRQHLREGAQGLQGRGEIISLSIFQPSFLQTQGSGHPLA